MLRLRDESNKVSELPSTCRFVELVDEEGNLGLVSYVDASGQFVILYPGDLLFDQYCKMFSIDKVASKAQVRVS